MELSVAMINGAHQVMLSAIKEALYAARIMTRAYIFLHVVFFPIIVAVCYLLCNLPYRNILYAKYGDI